MRKSSRLPSWWAATAARSLNRKLAQAIAQVGGKSCGRQVGPDQRVLPMYNQDLESPLPGGCGALQDRDRAGRCAAFRHPGTQPLASSRAQKRHRLGRPALMGAIHGRKTRCSYRNLSRRHCYRDRPAASASGNFWATWGLHHGWRGLSDLQVWPDRRGAAIMGTRKFLQAFVEQFTSSWPASAAGRPQPARPEHIHWHERPAGVKGIWIPYWKGSLSDLYDYFRVHILLLCVPGTRASALCLLSRYPSLALHDWRGLLD